MFGLFKKKDPIAQLEAQYKKLLEESFKLSKINRKESDAKAFEADQVLAQIEELKKGKSS